MSHSIGDFVSRTENCRFIYYISRCKDSANRAKYQRNYFFSLYFRDAAYLRDIYLKDNGKFRLSEKNTNKSAFLSARNLSKSFTHPKQCYFLWTHNFHFSFLHFLIITFFLHCPLPTKLLIY